MCKFRVVLYWLSTMYLSFADAVASEFGSGARVWELARSPVSQMGLDMTRRQLQATQGATLAGYPPSTSCTVTSVYLLAHLCTFYSFVPTSSRVHSDFFLYTYIGVGSCHWFVVLSSFSSLIHQLFYTFVLFFIGVGLHHISQFRIVFIRWQVLSVFTTVSVHRL